MVRSQPSADVSSSPRQHGSSVLNLFFAIDDGFAMPLAAVLQSVFQNLGTMDRVEIVVGGTGLRSENRRKLTRIVEQADAEGTIDFVVPDTRSISAFPTTRWHKLPVYVRLLIDKIVPSEWDRVLFLDGDVLVREDLSPFWSQSMEGKVAVGIQDFRNPTLGHRDSLAGAYLNDLGLAPDTVYCNAGVMLIDLEAWQRENVGARCIEFLQKYAEEADLKDQDALNAVLAGRWKVADPTWNVALSALPYYGQPEHETSEYRKEQARLERASKIVHFTGASKPWHRLYRRTMATEFFHYLIASRWFSRWAGRRWVWERRLSHALLRRMPDGMLTKARERIDAWRH